LVTFLVLLGVRESVRTGNVLVGFKVLIVLFVIAAGLTFLRPANLSDFAPHGAAGVTTAASVVFFGYIGFDAVSATAEEAKRPQRDLPIAIVGSLVACMVLYGLVALALTGMVSRDQLDATAPIARAFQGRGLSFASPLITMGALVSTFTVLLAFQIGLPRIFQAVARDGLLPARFAQIHPRFRIPAFTAIVGGLVTVVGAAFLPGTFALDLTNLGTLAVYVLVCLGVLVLRRTRPDAVRPFRAHWIFPVLGILMCVGLMLPLDALSQLVFAAWIGAGLLLYALYGWSRTRSTDKASGPAATRRGGTGR
jgi:APA family basic amino acid/polyamine antiporter